MTPVVLLLILANILVSWKGLRESSFLRKYEFDVDRILIVKEYYRVFTSGFLHSGWWHLFWNMFALYAFSGVVEFSLGTLPFILIYFSSLLGGKLFALFAHRHHGDYTSVGASGAVNGVIFASIVLAPTSGIGFFFIPLAIPAWIFGLAYMLITIYSVRNKSGNTNHESHLGGALIGILLAMMMQPSAVASNWSYILAITIPALAFVSISLLRPHTLILGFSKSHRSRYYTMDDRYNAQKIDQQKELDRILEKISTKGMGSLSRKEKELLKELSKTLK